MITTNITKTYYKNITKSNQVSTHGNPVMMKGQEDSRIILLTKKSLKYLDKQTILPLKIKAVILCQDQENNNYHKRLSILWTWKY